MSVNGTFSKRTKPEVLARDISYVFISNVMNVFFKLCFKLKENKSTVLLFDFA